MYKTCSRCQEKKLFADFHKNKSQADGFDNNCKICVKYYKEIRRKDISKYCKEYYKTNKQKLSLQMKEYGKTYREENKVKISLQMRKYHKEYSQLNRSKINSNAAKRRSIKLKALPKWLTKAEHEEMSELYEIARMFKLYTGEEYHVDHIVPLQGENVCGLHVPWNLQVIPAKENLIKSNKLQEDIL